MGKFAGNYVICEYELQLLGSSQKFQFTVKFQVLKPFNNLNKRFFSWISLNKIKTEFLPLFSNFQCYFMKQFSFLLEVWSIVYTSYDLSSTKLSTTINNLSFHQFIGTPH